jgi:diguanylate cyclase
MSRATATSADRAAAAPNAGSAKPRSLLEHWPLHPAEIEEREALIGLTPADRVLLASCWPAVRPEVDRLVTACLEQPLRQPAIRALVADRSTADRMQCGLVTYLESVFCAPHDAAHVDSRLRIGCVHRRIGLPARHFLAALHHLRVRLRQILATRIEDAARAACAVGALERRLLFDESLIIDAYEHRLLTEARREHNRALRYASALETQVAARTRELEQLSRTDALTGLGNRRAFDEGLAREINRSRRQHRPLAALYVDLDGFKALNDREGHGRGDEVLAAVAATLAASLREIDVVARLGGDEFCALLPDTDCVAAAEVADRLRREIRANCPVAASVGWAILDERDWDDPDGLIDRADAAMYRDKTGCAQRRAAAREAS